MSAPVAAVAAVAAVADAERGAAPLGPEEALLEEWRSMCGAESAAHQRACRMYRFLNNGVIIPAVLLTTASGVINIAVGTGGSCGAGSGWLAVGSGALALFASALSTLHRTLGLPDLQREHDVYGDEFAKLELEIRLQRALESSPAGGRPAFADLAEFAKHVKARLDLAIDKAPPVPRHLRARPAPRPG